MDCVANVTDSLFTSLNNSDHEAFDSNLHSLVTVYDSIMAAMHKISEHFLQQTKESMEDAEERDQEFETGVVIGSVLGGLLLLLIIVIGGYTVYQLCKRKLYKSASEANLIPFEQNPENPSIENVSNPMTRSGSSSEETVVFNNGPESEVQVITSEKAPSAGRANSVRDPLMVK